MVTFPSMWGRAFLSLPLDLLEIVVRMIETMTLQADILKPIEWLGPKPFGIAKVVNMLTGTFAASLTHAFGTSDHFSPFSLPFAVQDTATLFPPENRGVLKSGSR